MLRRAPLAAALALLTACGGAQRKPDPALTARVDQLEQEVARLRSDLAERDRLLVETLGRKIESVAERVAGLDETVDKLRSAPPAAPARPARPRPDPGTVYAVPIGDSPFEGPQHAKVTMVMFMEFACPFCRKSWATIAELRKKYPKDLKVVYKSFVVHPQVAMVPAQAACAAHEQGMWKEMADALWDRAFDARDFTEDNMLAIAKDLHLRPDRFQADLRGPRCQKAIEADQQILQQLGVAATPTFWINGRHLSGAQPIATFEALINEELDKASDSIKHGVKLRDYYDGIVRTGKTSL